MNKATKPPARRKPQIERIVAAFRAAFATADNAPTFDNDSLLEPSIMKHKIPQLEALAQSYGVTTRTLYRWKAAGANVSSLDSVAALLLRQRTPKSAALKSILSTYENDTKKRTAEN